MLSNFLYFLSLHFDFLQLLYILQFLILHIWHLFTFLAMLSFYTCLTVLVFYLFFSTHIRTLSLRVSFLQCPPPSIDYYLFFLHLFYYTVVIYSLHWFTKRFWVLLLLFFLTLFCFLSVNTPTIPNMKEFVLI